MYVSKAFSATERKYSMIERELTALVLFEDVATIFVWS